MQYRGRIAGHRRCLKCQVAKPFSEFPPKGPPDGRTPVHLFCLACGRPPKRYSDARTFTKGEIITRRGYIMKAKNKPCADCGLQFAYPAMEFDHARGDKKFALSCVRDATMEEIAEEISKCDVVCSNCHKVRTHNRLQATDETKLKFGPICERV